MIRHDVSREATASTLVAFPGPFAAPRGPFGERGAGFVIDAVVHSTRNVAVKDAAGAFVRFAAIACDVSTVRARRFDPGNGRELEPLATPKTALRKGYLNIFEHGGAQQMCVPVEEFRAALGAESDGAAGAAALPARLDPDGAAGRRLHPAVEGRFEFWGDATSMSEGDFSVGSVGERRIDN
eukprot:TRINITY_DN14_c0_g2_i2.p1 TRINITY_DN14_c0_g2~~TRINITY_DN14_c0_g2_i2.p1  ORF type:complete len:198 (-),score=60.79 TRINITY_DN14_c0_g2_i2:15-560(-)